MVYVCYFYTNQNHNLKSKSVISQIVLGELFECPSLIEYCHSNKRLRCVHHMRLESS
jgi:hypothetical protein